MAKRVVINTHWFYNEEIMNLVAINHEDADFGMCRQIKVTNKYGSYIFDCAFAYFVLRGVIALKSRQRRRSRLKKYHSYYVEANICNSPHTMTSVLNDQFDLKSKVGGANNVFDQLDNLLLPRLYLQSFVSQTGKRKPRGVLLSGPPGTGKTLIARTICEMLNIEPKIVRDPEIFSRFLGESEEKIRALFADARHEQEMLGDRSQLHIIVFDELDSISKRRTRYDESARDSVQDNVTTQLLAEIDGLRTIDNILIIGTTNRVETIDPALLRPGRIDLVIDVCLPDENDRIRIVDIYTKHLLQNGLMESDVDIEKIIRATDGFTGAHVERIVRLAVINAM